MSHTETAQSLLIALASSPTASPSGSDFSSTRFVFTLGREARATGDSEMRFSATADLKSERKGTIFD